MKNKGRRHKAGKYSNDDIFIGCGNCKGGLFHLTRPINSMSSKGQAETTFDKKKWIRKMRGYFKSQTKDVLNQE